MATKKRNSSMKKHSKSGRLAAAPVTLDEAIAAAPSIHALISTLRPTGKLEIGEHNTLEEVFDRDPEDEKGWVLCGAESLMWDAIKTAYFEGRSMGIESPMDIVPIALCHFVKEHGSDFIANPESFRIPTEEESDESERIARAIAYLDPRPELNWCSPKFRVDLALGGGEIPEEEE